MSLDLQTNPVNDILHMAFNQDFTCFACGTETGFRVYNTDPFRLTWSRDFEPASGLGVVAMLYRTNILAFVGGGKRPRLQPHKVVLWDDRQALLIAELTFRSPVRNIRLRRELVVVVLSNKLYVYGLRSLKLLDQAETPDNPKGLCCLSVGADRVVLVFPGMPQGQAVVCFYPNSFGEAQVKPERTQLILAHESPLAAMAVNADGTLLATASDKGTIIRIYDTETGTRRQELRRGADRAEIHSLVFSPSGEYLAVSSDKGTIHIFSVSKPSATTSTSRGGEADAGGVANTTSNLQRISRVLPAYFSSEWSFAQLRVTDYRCIAAFSSVDPHTIIVLCANGSYYKARFDPIKGGEMVREEVQQFDAASLEGEGGPGGSPTASGVGTSPPASPEPLPLARPVAPPVPPLPSATAAAVEAPTIAAQSAQQEEEEAASVPGAGGGGGSGEDGGAGRVEEVAPVPGDD